MSPAYRRGLSFGNPISVHCLNGYPTPSGLPHTGSRRGYFAPAGVEYPRLVFAGPRGVEMHWQRLSADNWVWD